MSQNHLTDVQLQDYLDGNMAATDPIAIHLDDCPRCQKALAVYRGLYAALEKDAVPELSPGFAEAVMARLPETQPAEVAEPAASRFQIKDSMVMFIAAAMAIAAAIYFISPETLLKAFSGLTPPSQLPEYQLLNDVNGFFSHLNISSLTIIFVVLTFAGIGVVDRIISHRREHQKPISFLI